MKFLSTGLVAAALICALTAPVCLADEAHKIPADYSAECGVPAGYDCSTPGFETPLTLEEAKELSKSETIVYLYGKGIWDVRFVAEVLGENDGKKEPVIPVAAVPGSDVPDNVFYVTVMGKVITHKVSGDPVEFYQEFLDNGELFRMSHALFERYAAPK